MHYSVSHMEETTAPMKSITVRLSDEQIRETERIALEERRDRSEIIRIAIDEFIEKQNSGN